MAIASFTLSMLLVHAVSPEAAMILGTALSAGVIAITVRWLNCRDDPRHAKQQPEPNSEDASPHMLEPPRRFWPGRLTEWGIFGVLAFGVFCFFCVPLGDFRGRRNPSKCRNNLRNISLALLNYEYFHKSLPPAFVADDQGKPMHSWRVLILPYIGERQLYDEYRFNEPWDGPHNSQLTERCPDIFRCPEDVKQKRGADAWTTSYLAVVGPETVWPGDQPMKLRDVSDGTVNTLLVVEVADSGINWMEPRDLHLSGMALTINSKIGKGISSAHTDCARVAFADGHVRHVDNSLAPETVRALLTRDGGEAIGDY